MQEEIIRLCNLIQGDICMPVKYHGELKQKVNMPNLCFKLVSNNPNCHDVKNCKILKFKLFLRLSFKNFIYISILKRYTQFYKDYYTH
jgi:hypothetical protein